MTGWRAAQKGEDGRPGGGDQGLGLTGLTRGRILLTGVVEVRLEL